MQCSKCQRDFTPVDFETECPVCAETVEHQHQSAAELVDAVRELAADVDEKIGFVPRIYIRFTQDTDDAIGGDWKPQKLEFGPYHSIEIGQGKMLVFENSGEDEEREFELAVQDGDYWRVHDGTEEEARWIVHISTVPPLK